MQKSTQVTFRRHLSIEKADDLTNIAKFSEKNVPTSKDARAFWKNVHNLFTHDAWLFTC